MCLKRFMIATAAVGMSLAVLASGASAAMNAEGEWLVEGVKLGAVHRAVKCEIGENDGAANQFVLTGVVGVAMTPITLVAQEIECIEDSIWNEGGHGKDTGELEFKNVSVSTPANCSVEGKAIRTNPVKGEPYMEVGQPNLAFEKFEADSGFTHIANVKITGASCAVAGTRTLKGYIFGEAENHTKAEAFVQGMSFSAAIDNTTAWGLEFAGNPARLTGRLLKSLTAKEKWGAE